MATANADNAADKNRVCVGDDAAHACEGVEPAREESSREERRAKYEARRAVERADAERRSSSLLAGIAITLAGCACWGLNGTLVKYLLDTYHMDPLWLVCVRELGSCWLFLAMAWFTARDRLTGIFRDRRDLVRMLVASFACVLSSNVCYVQSVSWTNSATTTVLQATCLVMVMVYVCVTRHRRPRKREIAGALLALVGTYLLATGGNPGALQIPPAGLAWGLGCALTAALLSILPVGLLERWGSMVFNGIAMLFSGAIVCAYVRPWECMPVLDATGWALVALAVVGGTFGAYALYLEGVKRVGSLRSSLLSTAEPLAAMISSVLWLGTTFSPTDLVGFAMIIVMVFLTA